MSFLARFKSFYFLIIPLRSPVEKSQLKKIRFQKNLLYTVHVEKMFTPWLPSMISKDKLLCLYLVYIYVFIEEMCIRDRCKGDFFEILLFSIVISLLENAVELSENKNF